MSKEVCTLMIFLSSFFHSVFLLFFYQGAHGLHLGCFIAAYADSNRSLRCLISGRAIIQSGSGFCCLWLSLLRALVYKSPFPPRREKIKHWILLHSHNKFARCVFWSSILRSRTPYPIRHLDDQPTHLLEHEFMKLL